MKLSTLRKLERATWSILKTLEPEAKIDPGAKARRDQFNVIWDELYHIVKAEENRWAERRDKGEILFTVFVPEKYYLAEKIRTPFRHITINHWRRTYPEPHYETISKPVVEIFTDKFSGRIYNPDYHFRQAMTPAA